MKAISILFCFLFFLIISPTTVGQALKIEDPWLSLDAAADDPLYTTYTASMERSRLYGDKGYKMDYWSAERPLSYAPDKSGRMYCWWKVNDVVVDKIPEYNREPIVHASFPDMAIIHYAPWPGLEVQECFFVYSSKVAMSHMSISNESKEDLEVEIYPIIEFDKDSLCIQAHLDEYNAVTATHYESRKRLISNLYAAGAYPTHWQDIFMSSIPLYSYGAYTGPPAEFYNIIKTDFYSEDRNDKLNMNDTSCARYMALHHKLRLAPGESANVRYLRGMQSIDEDEAALLQEMEKLKHSDLQPFLDENVEMFASVPHIVSMTDDERMMYIGAFNLARGCMLPPAGKTSHNFYVF
jgi:hypothetical protein